MNLHENFVVAALLAAIAAQPLAAADKPATSFVVVNEAVGVPVFPYDITDRPYTVLSEVKAGVRKATIVSNEASQKKIYHELWERAQKMGADAVVKAEYGNSHVSAFSWGKTNATGIAVKFTGPATSGSAGVAPMAAPETPPPAATPH